MPAVLGFDMLTKWKSLLMKVILLTLTIFISGIGSYHFLPQRTLEERIQVTLDEVENDRRNNLPEHFGRLERELASLQENSLESVRSFVKKEEFAKMQTAFFLKRQKVREDIEGGKKALAEDDTHFAAQKAAQVMEGIVDLRLARMLAMSHSLESLRQLIEKTEEVRRELNKEFVET